MQLAGAEGDYEGDGGDLPGGARPRGGPRRSPHGDPYAAGAAPPGGWHGAPPRAAPARMAAPGGRRGGPGGARAATPGAAGVEPA